MKTNNIKKLIIIAVVLAVIASIGFTGCNKDADTAIIVNVATPDGAPALALSKLISTNPSFNNLNGTVDYSVVMSDATTEAATVIGNKLVSGDYDMAILPTNVAANLYNKGAEIKLLTVNTWGNLFIVSKEAVITDINSIKGEVIYIISQSGPPIAVLKYILSSNGIQIAAEDEYTVDGSGFATSVADKVVIKYMPATTMIPNLKQGNIKYGLLGEPAVTNAINVIGGTAKIVLDLQEQWATLTGIMSYPQASLVARTEFINENKDFVNEFITELSAGDEWIANNVNIEAIKEAILGKAEASSLANITSVTVTRCGIETVNAVAAKTAIENYLAVFNITVDDNFYYVG